MKLKILFLTFLTLTALSCQSQQEIDFKVGYLPNFSYTLTQKQTSQNKVKYTGSEEVIKELTEKGIVNPTITNNTSTLKSRSKTGELKGDTFSLNVELLESSNPRLTSGTKFYGKSINGLTKIDSMSSSKMAEEKKAALLKAMESVMNQIKYPERKIKIGESFEQKSPISMPIGDVTIEIEINSIYTLQKVENGIGHFGLDQVYQLKSATKDYEMSLSGTGNGKIEYDIEKEFFTKYLSEMEMKLVTELNAFGVELETKSLTEQTTEVKPAGNNE